MAESSRLRIGFLSQQDPFDRNAFSSTPFYMLSALRRLPGLSVKVLGGYWPGPVGAIRRRLRGPHMPRADRIDIGGLDWVVAANSTRLLDALLPRLDCPAAHVTDATPAFLRDFYGRAVPPGRAEAEARVLARADRVVYSSAFMADLARREFPDLPAAGLDAVSFGLNLDGLPPPPGPKPPFAPLRLLFVGKDWDRKGGPLALEALDRLRASAREARLSVIGCEPEAARGHPGVDLLGYLDKNRTADYRRLVAAFREAHLFVLPTRADCTPMVVAEANAYGTPVLITRTGGIPSLMAEGQNGAMLAPDADGADWARTICRLTETRAAYDRLVASSHDHCRDRLTWDAWARSLEAILRQEPRG